MKLATRIAVSFAFYSLNQGESPSTAEYYNLNCTDFKSIRILIKYIGPKAAVIKVYTHGQGIFVVLT